jgi:hypothetical protein
MPQPTTQQTEKLECIFNCSIEVVEGELLEKKRVELVANSIKETAQI